MAEVELACQAVFEPKDFTVENVAKARKLMHDALRFKGVKTVYQRAPEWNTRQVNPEGGYFPAYWELNAWGLADE